MRSPRPSPSEPHAPPGIALALGLGESDDPLVTGEHEAALTDAAGLWPVAALAAVLVPAGIVAHAVHVGDAPHAVHVAAVGAPAALLAIGAWLLLVLTPARRLASHLRTALLALASGGIAASLTLVANSEVAAGVVGVVAAFGAIVITVAAVHAVRAATLAFTAALAATMFALYGATPASVVAMVLALMLTLGTLRQSRRHLARLGERQSAAGGERLARRLVAEYEGHGPGWFWQTDRQGRLTYLSDKVTREFAGFGIAAVGELLTQVFRVEEGQGESERTLTFHLTSRTSFSDYTVRPCAETAPERWFSISGRPLLDELGRFQGFIGSGSDLTEKRRAEAEITRLALFDGLTGLANRQRMRLSLDQLLSPANGSAPTGLLLLDLDRFKAVNDTLGHQMGDALLKQVAARLQKTVGEHGMVGRLGGDEFQVIMPREGNVERLGELAEAIITALSRAYYIDGSTLSIGCSIGVAIAPLHGNDPETLIRNADLALYAAKADGRGVHRFYRDELLEGAQNRKRLEDDLRFALQHDQLHLCYQPVVSTKDERIMGYEALLRWEHPTRGLISPADFVPVAEECGLIEAIGEWVMRTAAHEAATWPDHVRVAVNVSPIQFANPALPGIVTSALASSGLSAERLELEITEGVFLNEDASSEKMFKALKGLGVRLALDDFGTGYSSLGYLKKAPFDKIKIDQSFVRGAIMAGNRNAAIIKAIVTLADTLGMETTAEGVEQQDEIALIRELGCSHIQGYVYGRPARADVVHQQLAAEDGRAVAIGFKTSRAPRQRMLRSARIELGDEAAEVRIRDISASGVMVDGVEFPEEAIGFEVQIEVIEGVMLPATIRWADEGRAGLAFREEIDLDRLTAPAPRPALRRQAA